MIFFQNQFDEVLSDDNDDLTTLALGEKNLSILQNEVGSDIANVK